MREAAARLCAAEAERLRRTAEDPASDFARLNDASAHALSWVAAAIRALPVEAHRASAAISDVLRQRTEIDGWKRAAGDSLVLGQIAAEAIAKAQAETAGVRQANAILAAEIDGLKLDVRQGEREIGQLRHRLADVEAELREHQAAARYRST
jgi:hypothetical protein